jgi:acyl carrier protein
MNEIFENVAKALADYKEVDVSEIKMESTFEELGLDSLDIVEIMMNLEDVFSVELEMNNTLVDVKSVVEYIASLKG